MNILNNNFSALFDYEFKTENKHKFGCGSSNENGNGFGNGYESGFALYPFNLVLEL